MDQELLQELKAIVDERRRIIQEYKDKIVGDSIHIRDAEKAVDILDAIVRDYERDMNE